MPDRENSAEDAAAAAVVRVVGGSSEIHDTGAESGQFDVLITTAEQRTIALEVTSFGGDDWRRTRARIETQQRRGTFVGETLAHQWWVITPTGGEIRALQPRLEEVLAQLEAAGRTSATSRYEGNEALLRAIAATLAELRVSSASIWEHDPSADQPKILVSQSDSRIGTAGALPAAITAVFGKRDNQEKLARADTDERHLYVFMEDGGAGVVLQDLWPLPDCPPDPADVIDALWIYSPTVSAYLFRARPGSGEWSKYVAATGEQR